MSVSLRARPLFRPPVIAPSLASCGHAVTRACGSRVALLACASGDAWVIRSDFLRRFALFVGATDVDIDQWINLTWLCAPDSGASSPQPMVQAEIPRQNNSFDCGVFVCSFATSLALRLPIDFELSHHGMLAR